MESVQTQYQYRPLRTTHTIRLLDLSSRPSSEQEPLKCRLRHASLEQSPRYDTVSYVWGDPTPSHTLLVNGLSLKVPANTEQVLRRLALQAKTAILWIDAVCINQADKVERAQQITLMGRIYSGAKHNLIHLTIEDGMSERIRNAFVPILNEIEEDVGSHGGDFNAMVMSEDEEWLHSDKPIRTVLDEEALVAFFSTSWFSRVWVVQEAVLARESRFYYGSLEVDFDPILHMAVWLREYHLPHMSLDLLKCRGLYNAVSIWNYRRMFGLTGDVQLASMLDTSRDLDATDVRDKVFGVLGMCEQQPATDSPVELLKPDYTKSAADVIRDAVRYSVQTCTDPFYLLRNVCHRDEDDLRSSEFPSWVPRLDRRLETDIDSEVLPDHAFDSENTTPDRRLLADVNGEKVLKLRGKLLDKIQTISSSFDADTLGNLEAGPQFFSDLMTMCSQHDISELKLARTLIADTNHDRSRSTQRDLAGFKFAIDNVYTNCQIQPVSDLTPDADESVVKASYYWQAFLDASKNRRVAISTSNLLSLVPKVSRGADVLVRFDGSDTPFVLRPYGEEYLLLGECYIDGAMAWQEECTEAKTSLGQNEAAIMVIR